MSEPLFVLKQRKMTFFLFEWALFLATSAVNADLPDMRRGRKKD